MARGRIWLVVTVVAAVVAAAAPTASASGVSCADCSGRYTGSWSAKVQFIGSSATATYSVSLNWTETLKTPSGSTSGVWSLVSAQGTVSYVSSANPNADCTATLYYITWQGKRQIQREIMSIAFQVAP